MKYLLSILLFVFITSINQLSGQILQIDKNDKDALISHDDYKNVTILFRIIEPIGMQCEKKSGKKEYCSKLDEKFDKKVPKYKPLQPEALKELDLNYKLISIDELNSDKYCDVTQYPVFVDYKLEVQQSYNSSSLVLNFYLTDRQANKKCRLKLYKSSLNWMSGLKTLVKKINDKEDLKGKMIKE